MKSTKPKKKKSSSSPKLQKLTRTSQDDVVINVPKAPSLNQFYASSHWTIRKRAKDAFKDAVMIELNKYDPTNFDRVRVRLEYNYRYDVDNAIMAVKFGMDAFKEWGGIPDDKPKHWDKLTIKYCPEMEKGTAVIIFSKY